jgi:hypothetical protein
MNLTKQNLIEKIVDKFLDDKDFLLLLIIFFGFVIFAFGFFGMFFYRTTLESKIELAKIATVRVVECGCDCNLKCK